MSYARVDQAYRLALSKHLAAQRNLELIDDWHDGDVIPGDHWDREIRRKLDSANIIVLLLSADFFNSDYIHRVEIPCALERLKRGRARVVPVVIRAVVWKNTVFGGLAALPADGTPVESWVDRDEAWANVVEGIQRVVESFGAPRVADTTAVRPPPPPGAIRTRRATTPPSGRVVSPVTALPTTPLRRPGPGGPGLRRAGVAAATVAAMSVIAGLVICRGQSKSTSSALGRSTATIHGDRCAPSGLECAPSAGATLEDVTAAGKAGRSEDAVCLAQAVVKVHPEARISGPAWFEAASAWKAMGCTHNAADAIDHSIALRLHGDAGWKDTCVLCRQLHPGACDECRGLEMPPDALIGTEIEALSRGETRAVAALMDDTAVAIGPDARGLAVGPTAIAAMLDDYLHAIESASVRSSKTYVGQERDHAWIAQRLEVTTTSGSARSILLTQLAHQVDTPSGLSWKVTASHFAELLGNDDAQTLMHNGELPSPPAIAGSGPPELRAVMTEIVKSPKAIADAVAERQDAQWFGSAFGEVLLGGADMWRHFMRSDQATTLRVRDEVHLSVGNSWDATQRDKPWIAWLAANIECSVDERGGPITQTYRLSVVLLRGDEKWRIVQWHTSNSRAMRVTGANNVPVALPTDVDPSQL